MILQENFKQEVYWSWAFQSSQDTLLLQFFSYLTCVICWESTINCCFIGGLRYGMKVCLLAGFCWTRKLLGNRAFQTRCACNEIFWMKVCLQENFRQESCLSWAFQSSQNPLLLQFFSSLTHLVWFDGQSIWDEACLLAGLGWAFWVIDRQAFMQRFI